MNNMFCGKHHGSIIVFAVLVISIFGLAPIVRGEDAGKTTPSIAGEKGVLSLTLKDCMDIAYQRSRLRAISKESIRIAQAQHEQALSGWWPEIKLTVSGTRMDENPNFIFPARSVGGFQVPSQDVKLMDRDLLVSSLGLTYPLYTGGKVSALTKQAKIGIDVAKEDARQTDLQISKDIRQYYYGHILARKLYELGTDTLERFEATLDLTENLYKHGSGKTKKTDYLRTQVITASIRSAVELLKSNVELSRSALVNAMGLEWGTSIEIAENDIPFMAQDSKLEELVEMAHKSNTQMSKVRLGLAAGESKIDEARSGHLPILVFFGDITRLDNSYKGEGIMTDENRNSWKIGLALELPIFNGFRTSSQVQEAKARLEKLKQEQILLKEGVALQVKDAFLQMARSQGQVRATKEAFGAATENRDLNSRAYQQELVDAKDVIEAQLLEFFIQGQYLKALYENQANLAHLQYVVGNAVYEDH